MKKYTTVKKQGNKWISTIDIDNIKFTKVCESEQQAHQRAKKELVRQERYIKNTLYR